jgi:hypothetical protein
VQSGTNSAGLLALIDCRLRDENAVLIVKLKHETGSRLFREPQSERRHYTMEVLRDLFLTEGTRVFKCALFGHSGPDTRILVSDDQRPSTREYEIAEFFLEQFLGCKRIEVGHVVTKRFYNSTVEFINAHMPEGDRNDLYDDLTSQLRRRVSRIDARQFAREFLPLAKRDDYMSFIQSRGIPNVFEKDTSEIGTYLKKKQIRTEHGISITVPEEAQQFVSVEPNRIIIRDSTEKVNGLG